MLKKIVLSLLSLLPVFNIYAQVSPAVVLQRSVNIIHNLKSIRYTIKSVDKNPFSANDTSRAITESAQLIKNGTINRMCDYTNSVNGKPIYYSIYRNDSLFTVIPADSTYSIDIKSGNSVSSDLYDFANRVNDDILKSPQKIFLKHDTIIGHSNCYNIFVRSYDTVDNGNHNYNYYQVAINKKSMLPVYILITGDGTMEKGGMVIGRVSVFSEKRFDNYQLNESIPDDRINFNLAGFAVKYNKMLAVGDVAPPLKPIDLNGNTIPPTNFTNKILLIEFGDTGCGANALANPMLNRISEKYSTTQLNIMGIYIGDNANSIKKYIVANQLMFPIYTGSPKLAREFRAIATPNFYLVDKNGKILKSINGYYPELEKELCDAINEQLKQ